MADVTFRLPGKEQYSYVEVKFAREELEGPGGYEEGQQLLKDTLDALNATFPNAKGQSNAAAGANSSGGSSSNGEQIPSCQHGQRVKKDGNSAKGSWSAYFCPERDRNQQCKPIDAKTGKSW